MPNLPVDERNWPAMGDMLYCTMDAGCTFLKRGSIYQAVSDVVDNHVAIVDDSGDVNEYLASHFTGYRNQPLPTPTGRNKWKKVIFYIVTDYGDEAVVSEVHHMARRLRSSATRISVLPINDNTKPNESH